MAAEARKRLAFLPIAAAIALIGVSAAVTPAPARAQSVVPQSFYGVVPQAGLGVDDLARMGQGKIGTLRTFVNWAAIDLTADPADDNWVGMDLLVAEAARNGVQVLPFVYGTPTWVAQTLDGRGCAPTTCGVFAPQQPAAIAEWQRFLGEAVGRYGPGGQFWIENPDVPPLPITVWQLWNEQNSKTFYKPKPNPAAYANLVAAGQDAILARDPAAKVLLGGMFGTPGGEKKPKLFAQNFLRKLYAVPGFADTFTGVAAHPYSARLTKVKEQTKLLRKEIVRAGDDAELWITEVGWSSGDGKNPLERGMKGQANRLRDAMRYFIGKRTAYKIQNVTWFAWRDLAGPPICDWCGEAGLFKASSLTPKPAWNALMAFTGGS